MKKIIQIYSWLLFSLSVPVFAQSPTVDITTFPYNHVNGIYYKDIQGLLNKYVGTWECEYEENGINKKFVLTLTKIEEFYMGVSGPTFYTDGLVYQYDIYHNNNLIYNSPTSPFPQAGIRPNDKTAMIFVDYLRRGIIFDVEIQYAPVIQQGGGGQERLYFDRATASQTLNRYHRDNPTESYSSMPTNIFLTRVD
ncbi:MAG: DUF6705 family protein [Flavobacterium sp.]